MQCEAACMNLTEAMSLSVTSTGRLGIKIPQRNLLVMERAQISLSLSLWGKCAGE